MLHFFDCDILCPCSKVSVEYRVDTQRDIEQQQNSHMPGAKRYMHGVYRTMHKHLQYRVQTQRVTL